MSNQQINSTELENKVSEILQLLGQDPSRGDLKRTPKRVSKSLQFLTSGYQNSLEKAVQQGIFESSSTAMVMQTGIEFYSMCEHHMLPFFGTIDIAYLPKGKIIGLSKLGRIVDLYARRLQVQENLTEQIARALITTLNPDFVSVKIRAKHFCMMMRGVEKHNSETTTHTFLGPHADSASHRLQIS